jgi:hypothetical protein
LNALCLAAKGHISRRRTTLDVHPNPTVFALCQPEATQK